LDKKKKIVAPKNVLGKLFVFEPARLGEKKWNWRPERPLELFLRNGGWLCGAKR
jgi:hypothetical protein